MRLERRLGVKTMDVIRRETAGNENIILQYLQGSLVNYVESAAA